MDDSHTSKPSVNPDRDCVADHAKHHFARGTKAIADLAYRIAELAGTGKLGAEAVWDLQSRINRIREHLYWGTLSAVRDPDTVEPDRDDNTYSDGRQVVTRIQIEPRETAEHHWEHNGFLLEDNVWDYPRETISVIADLPESSQRGL